MTHLYSFLLKIKKFTAIPPNSSLLSSRKVYEFVATEVMYSSDTLPSLCLSGLFPLSDSWD